MPAVEACIPTDTSDSREIELSPSILSCTRTLDSNTCKGLARHAKCANMLRMRGCKANNFLSSRCINKWIQTHLELCCMPLPLAFSAYISPRPNAAAPSHDSHRYPKSPPSSSIASNTLDPNRYNFDAFPWRSFLPVPRWTTSDHSSTSRVFVTAVRSYIGGPNSKGRECVEMGIGQIRW